MLPWKDFLYSTGLFWALIQEVIGAPKEFFPSFFLNDLKVLQKKLSMHQFHDNDNNFYVRRKNVDPRTSAKSDFIILEEFHSIETQYC